MINFLPKKLKNNKVFFTLAYKIKGRKIACEILFSKYFSPLPLKKKIFQNITILL
jgi:hypothetical protein